MNTRRQIPVGRTAEEVLANEVAKLRAELKDLRSTALGRLASSGVIRKTATQSFTTAVLDDDDELAFAVGVDEIWAFEAVLHFDGATAGDLVGEVTTPAGATLAMQAWGPQVAATFTGTAASPIQVAGGLASGGDFVFGCAGAGTILAGRLVGLVRVGATAGTVQLRVAQNAASGTATRVFIDSYLTVRRVA
jgi:hypothetical protein